MIFRSKTFYFIIILLGMLSCAHRPAIERSTASISEYGLPVGVVGLLNAEQLLLSRDLNEYKIYSPKKSDQAEFFKPENQNVFEIKSYWVSEEDFYAFKTTSLDPKLEKIMHRTVDGVSQWRLLVHPESENFYKELVKKATRAKNFLGTATSSSRSLVVWPIDHPELAFFGKLSLDKEIAGSQRTILGAEIARSVGTSELLDLIADDLPKGFRYFPESIGLMPNTQERGGMLVREIPEAIKNANEKFIPLFSLYGECEKCNKRPLLVDMIKRSGIPADEFVRTKIISPFLDQWISIVLEQGISVEAHAQNVLIGLGDDMLPNGEFLHRDFGGFHIDFSYRQKRGLRIPENLPIIHDLEYDYHRRTHNQAISTSLHIFFDGGFLYNLDQNIPAWAKAGLINEYKNQNRKEYFQKMLYAELAKKLGAPKGVDLRDQRAFLKVANAYKREILKKSRTLTGNCDTLVKVILK